MFKKKTSYGPAADEILAAWPSRKKSKQKINWGIDRGTAVIYLVMLVVAPLIALAITFYNQRNERIDCSKLSRSSISYLQQVGEEIPLDCGLDR